MNAQQAKFLFILGGFLGFSLSLVVGLIVENPIVIVLRNGAIGCLSGFFLMRILVVVIRASLKNVIQEKRAMKKRELEIKMKENLEG